MDIRKRKIKGYFVLSAIVILCLCFVSAVSFFAPQNAVDGAVISNATKINTDLLLTSRDTTVGGRVFNADALSELYKELGASSTATFSTVSSKAHTLKNTYSNSSVFSIHSGMTSADIRSASLSKKNIVVTLGGKEWIVVALTTKDQTSSSDVVLTLMLKDIEYTTQWAKGTVNSAFNVNYPISMYSSSYIRAGLLNGKDSNGNKVYFSNDRVNNNQEFVAPDNYYPSNIYPFGIFSDSSVTNNITNFIVRPNEVLYQQYENRYDSVNRTTMLDGYYTLVNDASKNTIASSKWNSQMGTVVVESKTGYFDWGNDYIWLPGLAETGGYTSSVIDLTGISNANGLWQLDDNQRGVSAGKATWLRSGAGGTPENAMTLNPGGHFVGTGVKDTQINVGSSGLATGTLGVRPCLNLNLTDAEKSSASPLSAPNAFSNEYNGSAQKIDSSIASWYTTEYADAVNVKYYDTSTEPKTELPNGPTDVGSYEAEFTLKDNKHYWSDNSGGSTRSVIFNITTKQIEYPTFLNNHNSDEYAGGSEIIFTLTGFNSSYMDMSVSADNGSSVTLDKSRGQIKVTNVDKYKVSVTLTDTNNYEWKSTTSLECEVEQAEIEVDITSASGEYNLTGVQGGNLTVNLIVSNGKGARGDDPVTIYVTANYTGLSSEDISSIELKKDSPDRHQITLDLSNLIKDLTYKLDVRSSDPNYKAVLKNINTNLDVLDPSTRTKITWNLYEDGDKVFDKYADAELTDYNVELGERLTYNGKAYTFDVSLPSGCELDPSYGYKVDAETTGNTALGINADTYTTSIKLLNGQIYSIKWTIDKAKFDLSNVKWQYPDGQMPFAPNGVSEELDTSTVPPQLQISYSGNRRGTRVDEIGTVTVSFDLSSEDEQNYIKPVSNDKNSYEFTADGSITDFEWEKSWKVVACVIPVEWIDVTKQDVNGKEYTVKALKGDYDDIVEYYYYETNGAGEILDEQNPVKNLVVVDKEVKFYKAKPVIQSRWGNNYVLESEDYSQYFSIGESEVAVGVTLENTQLTYNGNAQEVKIKIVSGFTLTSNLQITYYDKGGIAPLSNAPTNVGKYEAWISFKDGVSGFYLAGDNVEDGVAKIEYEILRKQVDNSEWKTTYNPPSLKLQNKDDLNWIDYEYEDMDGNSLEFSDLQPGNTYRVRAVVKDKYNNIFSDGTTETEWKEFTIGANEVLYDPTDPNSPDEPNAPIDPDDPTDPTTPEDPEDNGDFDKVLETLKDWWQVIVSGVSILFILLFLGKALAYESKRRKAKKETNEKYATFYAVSGTGLFGLSMSNWTIMACCLAGGAVLSLVFMIIAKSRCNKAVNELSKSKDEFDRRSREEELKRMFMMLSGNANMNGAMGGQGYAYAQQGLGAEEIRGIVSETMTAMLPNVQQYLPQQASTNDELVQKLIEQNEHNEQMIEKLMAKLAEQPQKREFADDEVIEKLAKKLAEKQPVENIVEREVATSGQIIEKTVLVDKNDDIIQKLVEGQEKIM
ncbi:MAG: hypothetical protein K2H36_01135, partial [Clostridia bacterium]|nr:hypothetical protein [Clostridia bacterium]